MVLGKRAEFKCSVKSADESAAAEVDIWWQFGNQNISQSERFKVGRYNGHPLRAVGVIDKLFPQVSVSKSADGNVSSQLVITSSQWEDAGLYSCVGREKTSRSQRPTKQDIALTVLCTDCFHILKRLPLINVSCYFRLITAGPKEDQVKNGKGEVGDTTEMWCSFKAKPVPTIQWLKYGIPIEEDDSKYEITTEKVSDISIRSHLKIMK